MRRRQVHWVCGVDNLGCGLQLVVMYSQARHVEGCVRHPQLSIDFALGQGFGVVKEGTQLAAEGSVVDRIED